MRVNEKPQRTKPDGGEDEGNDEAEAEIRRRKPKEKAEGESRRRKPKTKSTTGQAEEEEDQRRPMPACHRKIRSDGKADEEAKYQKANTKKTKKKSCHNRHTNQAH